LADRNTSLVVESSAYNNIDKIVRKNDSVSGTGMSYTYAGKRLATSQAKNGPVNSYSYDNVENLVNKKGVSIQYSPVRALGHKDGKQVFDVSYEAAGRVSRKVTDELTYAFTHDSFGGIKIPERRHPEVERPLTASSNSPPK
jgi:hypothetical protein